MAIQMRRGAYAEFDPLKMKAGEWAVSTDSDTKKQQIWMCFAPGIVKRMGTVEDFDVEIQRLIQNYLDGIAQSVSQAQKSAELAANKAQESANSASNAKASETNSKTSETNASNSAAKAKNSETNAKTSETKARTSETSASTSASNAKTSETKAKVSETNAKKSETNASTSATNAKTSETNAKASATSASTFASNAKASETKAKASETNAKTSETNSAKSESEAQKYAEQAQEISESLSGALRPLGTINFADLPSTADANSGDMYNITGQFATTTDFKEGAGNVIPAGSNVYLTADRYWDVLAGTPVTGVKGAKEVYYRRGNVNITPANIGAVAEGGNISDTTVIFADTTTRANLVSGEKVSVGFGKIKKWFADLKSFAFKNLVNNLTTSTTGSALDASQGKILNDKYDELNQRLDSLSNKQDWKKIGEFGDVNEHVISNIKNYQELRVNFMLFYSGDSYITRDYVFPVSESKNLEFLFLDGNYYDSNNYTSWCIVYNTARNSIQNRSSWLRSVILGKDTTCQCVYRVYGR
nr:MAG TPA: tail fiber protein [Caudoviricetes sp.]